MIDSFRQLVRSLRSSPGFTAVVLLTFALGIGATTAIYSVVSHVLLRPLPYPEADRLVGVWTTMPEAGIEQLAVAHAEYLDYRAESQLIAEAGAAAVRPGLLTGAGEPAKITYALTTASLWQMLGIDALLGRTLVAGDDDPGAEPVAILSHGVWQSRFGADPAVIGQSVQLDGVGHRVVGVMPPSFAYPRPLIDIWVAYPLDPQRRDNHHLQVLARMRDGVSFESLQPEMDAIVARWAEQYDHAHPFLAIPFSEQVLGGVRRPLLLLLGAVGMVLLISAVNVAGLLLARGEARQRELALRSALGARRLELIRQVLGESLLLAAVGGILGLGLAKLGLKAIIALEPGNLPRIDEIGLDLQVLAAAVLVSALAGLCAGLIPAWRVSRPNLAGMLRSHGERTASASTRQRLRGGLVVVETAIAVMLVVVSTLLLQSLAELYRADPGIEPTHILAAQVSLPADRYADAATVNEFYDAVVDRLRALPGVTSVGIVNSLPMRDTIRMILVGGPWQPPEAEPVGADVVMASPDYLQTLGNQVLRGRAFSVHDRPGAARVAIVNESAARALFGERDPLGKPLHIIQATPQEPAFEVVGLVRDVPTTGLGAEVRPQVYLPLAQAVAEIRGVTRSVSVALKTAGRPEGLAAALRAAVWELDDGLAISNIETMDQVVAASLRPQRFQTVLLGLFAGLALTLAAVGLYGLLAHVVGLRRREIAIRLALGAHPIQLKLRVLGHGLLLVSGGVVVGVFGSMAIRRLLEGLLYGVSESDLTSLAVTAVVLLGTAALASYLPARRAADVDPIATLREE